MFFILDAYQFHFLLFTGVSFNQIDRRFDNTDLVQVTAIAGFRTRYGDACFIPIVTNQTTQTSSTPNDTKTDSIVELDPEEQELALDRWRQMKLVVMMFVICDLQNIAITRITGEEDVHGIENAEDIEEEISLCLIFCDP